MEITQLIEKHEVGMNLVLSIEYFQKRIAFSIDQLIGQSNENLREYYQHKIKIYDKCIERLMQRHNKLFN